MSFKTILVVNMFKLHVLKKAESRGEVCNSQSMGLVYTMQPSIDISSHWVFSE